MVMGCDGERYSHSARCRLPTAPRGTFRLLIYLASSLNALFFGRRYAAYLLQPDSTSVRADICWRYCVNSVCSFTHPALKFSSGKPPVNKAPRRDRQPARGFTQQPFRQGKIAANRTR